MSDKPKTMSNEPKGKYCNGCVHLVNIPGNYHIGCNNPNAKPERKTWPGCGIWPLNFDPATVQSCDGFSRDKKDKINRDEDPLLDLARMLAG